MYPGTSLYPRYNEPYYIIYKIPNHSYKLRNCKTNRILKFTIHANRLKLYKDPRDYKRRRYLTRTQPQTESDTVIAYENTPDANPQNDDQRAETNSDTDQQSQDNTQQGTFTNKQPHTSHDNGDESYEAV